MSNDRRYGVGIILLCFGGAGMAEAITGQGVFMAGAVLFSVGLGLILSSYVGHKN